MASLCTAKVLRDYFLDGKLPENGIVCPTDEVLFPPKESTTTDKLSWLREEEVIYSEEDRELLKTMKELGSAWMPGSRGMLF